MFGYVDLVCCIVRLNGGVLVECVGVGVCLGKYYLGLCVCGWCGLLGEGLEFFLLFSRLFCCRCFI